jgi:hypothetical protein
MQYTLQRISTAVWYCMYSTAVSYCIHAVPYYSMRVCVYTHTRVHTHTWWGEPAGSRSPPPTRQGLVACRAGLGKAAALRRARRALPCPSRLAPRSSAGLSDSMYRGRRHRV